MSYLLRNMKVGLLVYLSFIRLCIGSFENNFEEKKGDALCEMLSVNHHE